MTNFFLKLFWMGALATLCTPALAAQPFRFKPDDQIGGMSLEENFALAKKFPKPSAWLQASTCAACHGTYGREFGDIIPPLAGMPRQKFIDKMHEYQKSDWHNFIVMGIVAEPFTEEEIRDMGAFFEKQPPEEWTPPDWNSDVVIPEWAREAMEHPHSDKPKERRHD
jgi:sulfide dehydrogenase cytochrome subunit